MPQDPVGDEALAQTVRQAEQSARSCVVHAPFRWQVDDRHRTAFSEQISDREFRATTASVLACTPGGISKFGRQPQDLGER
jgi:hypothetical protein